MLMVSCHGRYLSAALLVARQRQLGFAQTLQAIRDDSAELLQRRDPDEAARDAHGAGLGAGGHAWQPLDHAQQALVVLDQPLVQRRCPARRAVGHVKRHLIDWSPLRGHALSAAHARQTLSSELLSGDRAAQEPRARSRRHPRLGRADRRCAAGALLALHPAASFHLAPRTQALAMPWRAKVCPSVPRTKQRTRLYFGVDAVRYVVRERGKGGMDGGWE